MSQKRIALLGEPGSGKSSVAAALGYTLSFASALRMELARVLADNTGRPPMDIYEEMEYVVTKDNYRTLLQGWGTWRRSGDNDYWVRQVERRLTLLDDRDIIAVDDCRYPNEYDMLKEQGFYFVRLMEGPYVRSLTTEQREHPSEIWWRDFEVDKELSFAEGVQEQARRIVRLMS